MDDHRANPESNGTKYDAKASGDFCMVLAQLAQRLAARDFLVSKLCSGDGPFGMWELIVYHGSEAVRFFWDGREHQITVDISPIRPLYRPNEFQRDTERRLLDFGESIRFVEMYLTKKYWADYDSTEA